MSVSLGDILKEALEQKGTTMRTYEVSISLRTNNKKITAIREIRDAFGIGLGEAKAFVENSDIRNGYTTVRLNERQLGRYAALADREVSLGYGTETPNYIIGKVREIKPEPKPEADFSHIVLA